MDDLALESTQGSYLRMWELYKRFVKTWIRFANPWIRSQSVWVCWGINPDSYVMNPDLQNESIYGVQRFVSQTVFDKIRPFFTCPTNPHKSLQHRRTTNPYKSWGLDWRIPTVFKRFVSWIRFILRCSKDSFLGFNWYYGVQKICFVDSFHKTKNLKRFNSFRFGRICVRILHPQSYPQDVPFRTLLELFQTFLDLFQNKFRTLKN